MPDGEEFILKISIHDQLVTLPIVESTNTFIVAQEIAQEHGLDEEQRVRLENYIDQLKYSQFVQRRSTFNAPIRLNAAEHPRRFVPQDRMTRSQAMYVERLNAGQPTGVNLFDSPAAAEHGSGLRDIKQVGRDRFRIYSQGKTYQEQEEYCAKLAQRGREKRTDARAPKPVRVVESVLIPNSEQPDDLHEPAARAATGHSAPGLTIRHILKLNGGAEQQKAGDTLSLKSTSLVSPRTQQRDGVMLLSAVRKKPKRAKERGHTASMEHVERLYSSARETRHKLDLLREERQKEFDVPSRPVQDNSAAYYRLVEQKKNADSRMEEERRLEKQRADRRDRVEMDENCTFTPQINSSSYRLGTEFSDRQRRYAEQKKLTMNNLVAEEEKDLLNICTFRPRIGRGKVSERYDICFGDFLERNTKRREYTPPEGVLLIKEPCGSPLYRSNMRRSGYNVV